MNLEFSDYLCNTLFVWDGVHDDVTASNQVVSKLSASCLQVVSMSRCRMTGTMSMTDPGPDNQIARHGLMLASDDKICKFFAPVSPRPAPHRAALRCKVAAPPATRHLHTVDSFSIFCEAFAAYFSFQLVLRMRRL